MVRIARDTTVNDYVCCNGVKCLCPSFTHSSLTNDTCDLSDYVTICVMSHTAVTTRGTGLLLARDTGLLGSPCPHNIDTK